MADRRGNLANLKPWGPDNPPPRSPGRPRKRPQSEAYEEWLRTEIPPHKVAAFRAEGIILKKGATNADMVAMAMGKEAIKGNVNAAKEMRESVEGKATQRIEMSHADGRAPEFVVMYATPIPGEDLDTEEAQRRLAMAKSVPTTLEALEVIAVQAVVDAAEKE